MIVAFEKFVKDRLAAQQYMIDDHLIDLTAMDKVEYVLEELRVPLKEFFEFVEGADGQD